MKPVPAGDTRISSNVFYEDASAAIDFLCRAFGFEVRVKVEGANGAVPYSELTFGEGVVHVSTARGENRSSPRAVGGAITQSVGVIVDDVDAHYAHAKAAGADIIRAPENDDYGDDFWTDRSYGARDPEGHHWWFWQRLKVGANFSRKS